MTETTTPHNFIRTLIDDDLASGKHTQIVTRFPPEPNGYLHIGHAKSICLNFGIAKEYANARCHLRFDDTNPLAEDTEYVDSIQDDVRWLGFDWHKNLFFASDYFERMYDMAVHLIEQGKAYVCSLSEEDIRTYRGTVTEAGRKSPGASRTVAENLQLFRDMRDGKFPDGAHVLRANIDMAAANMKMRDPLLYRIRHAHHHRTGNAWCIYPMYDFAHPLSDAFENITHSLCTLEFENNRELYDWVVANTPVTARPVQTEFARLSITYTILSKRKLRQLVEDGNVSGWSDPRMPTLSGLRRRGYTPEAIRTFCERIGVAKANSTVDVAQLEHAIREDLNQRAPRVMCVQQPLRVVIDNYPENQVEQLDAPYFPEDVGKPGSRNVPFTRTLFIEHDDFMEQPPKDYHRLAPGQEVRLRYAYVIRCERVVKDAQGNVTELRCSYDPTTRGGQTAGDKKRVKGTIQWVSEAHAVRAEVRLYDRLFAVPSPDAGEGDFKDYLNPHSLVTVSDACLEPSVLTTAQAGGFYQFERQGFFCVDSEDSSANKLVFNRTVALRDSWAKPKDKEEGSQETLPQSPKREARHSKPQAPAQVHAAVTLPPEQEALADSLQQKFGLARGDAVTLAQHHSLRAFFEDAVAAHNNPKAIANWVVNSLQGALKERGITDAEAAPFPAAHLGELVQLVDNGAISGAQAKTVFEQMLQPHGHEAGREAPSKIVARLGLTRIADPAVLTPIVDQLIAAHPDNVARYREGRTNLFGFFVGQAMAATEQRADPKVLAEILRQRLDASR